MDQIDKAADGARQAYWGTHNPRDTRVPWDRLDPADRAAWRSVVYAVTAATAANEE